VTDWIGANFVTVVLAALVGNRTDHRVELLEGNGKTTGDI
jgi:hypothetical protein